MKPLRVAWVLIGMFIVAERLLRQGQEARTWEAMPSDRGTTNVVGRAFGTSILAFTVAPVLNKARIGRIHGILPARGGVVVILVGFGLRIWATRALGESYTRTLRTNAQQRLVKDGPYRLIRHPGYLGTLLLWLGAAVATMNGIAAATIALAMGRTYPARIAAEEDMLAQAFPEEFPSYTQRTWRLIPFVY